MEDEATNLLRKGDESLNFLSDQFDPLRALYKPNLQPPIPNIHVFNNIAEYARAIREGKTKARPSVPAREALEPNRRTRNLKPEFKQPDIGSRLKAIAQQKAEKGQVVGSGVKAPLLGDQTAGKTLGFGTEQRWKKKYKNVLERMDECVSGPFSILYKCLKERYKVQVWIRKYKGLRSVLTGFVIAFDKHMNLALMDVDELYTVEERVERPPTEELKTGKKKKKKKRKKKKKVCEMKEKLMEVCEDKENKPSVVTKSKDFQPPCADSVSFLRQKMSSTSLTVTNDNVTTAERLDLLPSYNNNQEQYLETKATNPEESQSEFPPQETHQTSDTSTNTTSSSTSQLCHATQETEDQEQSKITLKDKQIDPTNPSYLFSQDLTVRVPAIDDDVSRDMEFTLVGIFQPKSTQESSGDGNSSVELPDGLEFKIPMSFSQHFASTSNAAPFEKIEGIRSKDSKDLHPESESIHNLTELPSSLSLPSETNSVPSCKLKEENRDSVEDHVFVDRMSYDFSERQQWEPPLSFRYGAGIEAPNRQDIPIELASFSSDLSSCSPEVNVNTNTTNEHSKCTSSESQTILAEMETVEHHIEEACEQKLDYLMPQSQSTEITLAQLETDICGLEGHIETTKTEVMPIEGCLETCSYETEDEKGAVVESQSRESLGKEFEEKSSDVVQLAPTTTTDVVTKVQSCIHDGDREEQSEGKTDIVARIQSNTLDYNSKEKQSMLDNAREDEADVITKVHSDTLDSEKEEQSIPDHLAGDKVGVVTKVKLDKLYSVKEEQSLLDDVAADKVDVVTNVQANTLDYETLEKRQLMLDDLTQDKEDATKVQSKALDLATEKQLLQNGATQDKTVTKTVTKLQADTLDYETDEQQSMLDDVTEDKDDATQVQLHYAIEEQPILNLTEDKGDVVTKVQSDSLMLDDVTEVVTTVQSDDMQKKQLMKLHVVAKEHGDVTEACSTLSEMKEDNMGVLTNFQSSVPKEQLKEVDIAKEDQADEEKLKELDHVREGEVDITTNLQQGIPVIVDVTAQAATKVNDHDVPLLKLEKVDDVTEDVTNEQSMEPTKGLDCVTKDKKDVVINEQTERMEQSLELDDDVTKVQPELMEQSTLLDDVTDKLIGVTKVQPEPIEQSIGPGDVMSANLSQPEITDSVTAEQLKTENNNLMETINVLPKGVEKAEPLQQEAQEDNIVSVGCHEAKNVTLDQVKISDNKSQEELPDLKVNTVKSVFIPSEMHSGVMKPQSDYHSDDCPISQACEGPKPEDEIKCKKDTETSLETEGKHVMGKLTGTSGETPEGSLQTAQGEKGTLSGKNFEQDENKVQCKGEDVKIAEQGKEDKEQPNGNATLLSDSAKTKDKTTNIDSEKEEGEITSSDEEENISHQKSSEAQNVSNSGTLSKKVSVWDRLGSGKTFSMEASRGSHKESRDSKKSRDIDRERMSGKNSSRRLSKHEERRQMKVSDNDKTSSDEKLRKGKEDERKDKVKGHGATERRRHSSIESAKEMKTEQKRESKEVQKEKRGQGAQRTTEKSREKSSQDKSSANRSERTSCTAEKDGKVGDDKQKSQRKTSVKSNEKSPHSMSSTKSKSTSFATHQVEKQEKGSERGQRKTSGKSKESKSHDNSDAAKNKRTSSQEVRKPDSRGTQRRPSVKSGEKSKSSDTKSDSTSASLTKEVVKDEKENQGTQRKRLRISHEKSSHDNSLSKSERTSAVATKDTRKEKFGTLRKKSEKSKENVSCEKPVASNKSERKKQQPQSRTGETATSSIKSKSQKAPSVEKTIRREEVLGPEKKDTKGDNSRREDSQGISSEKSQQKINDKRTCDKTTRKRSIGDSKADKQQKEDRKSVHKSTKEATRHKDITSASVSTDQTNSQQAGEQQRKGTNSSKLRDRTITRKGDKISEKGDEQEEIKRKKDVQAMRETQTAKSSRDARSSKGSSLLTSQSSKGAALSNSSDTSSGNMDLRPSRKLETRKTTKNVNVKVSRTSAATTSNNNSEVKKVGLLPTPVLIPKAKDYSVTIAGTSNNNSEVKKVGLLPTPVLIPKAKDYSTTIAGTREIKDTKDKRDVHKIFSTTKVKRKPMSVKKRKFLQESNHERQTKRRKLTQESLLSKISEQTNPSTLPLKRPDTQSKEEQTTTEGGEGTSKVSAPTRRMEIGKGRFLTFKRRHVNQLFIRGDNVVMVSYAT